MAISQELLFKLGANSKGLRAALQAVKRDVKAAVRDVAMIGAAIGVQSVRKAVEFEAAMAEVNTIMRGSPAEVAAMSKALLDLSLATGRTTQELTGGLYDALSAGVPKENAIDFLAVASRAAIGGVTDTKTAVKGITAVMAGFGLTTDETANIADAFFTTVRLGKTTFPELAANIGKVAAIANSAGIGLDEVAAAMATMTLTMKTEESATMLRGAIIGLTKASPALIDAMGQLGFSSATAMLETMTLQEALQKIAGTTDGTNEAMIKLFPSVEAMRGVLALTGTAAATANTHLEEMSSKTGSADAAFATMANTGKMALSQLNSAVGAAFITIGTELIPQVREMAVLLAAIASDPERLQGLVMIFQGVGIAIQGAIVALEKFFNLMEKPTNFLAREMLLAADPDALNRQWRHTAAISDEDVNAARALMASGMRGADVTGNFAAGVEMVELQRELLGEIRTRLPAANSGMVSTSTAGVSGGSM